MIRCIWNEQTMKTQIILLLKEQPDLGLQRLIRPISPKLKIMILSDENAAHSGSLVLVFSILHIVTLSECVLLLHCQNVFAVTLLECVLF